MPPSSRLSPLVEKLRSDQRRRWLENTPCRVEEYLSTHPELATDREALLDLVYAEVCLRQELGDPPGVEEYVQRFPQFKGDLVRLFEVDEAVRQSPDGPSCRENTITIDNTQTASTSSPDLPNRIGDYDILGEIARGGMGVVFKAWQRSLNRPVALKVILDSEWANPDQIVRFRNEAETVAKLDHPGIVAIYEIGHERGQHYFAMAYVDGKTLHEQIRAEPLPPAEAARLMQNVAEAVQFAHAKRILHRDLKPQNILLDRQGCPKVVDFGLAKRLDLADGQTATGAVLGTPSYMAPEQALGKSAESDATVDVYGLGAVLYATLTGRPPFKSAALADTLRQVIDSEPVPPRQLNSSIPRDLETICLKCLEKSPARRYASAADMAADLGRFLRKEPIVARPVGRAERTWRWCLRNPLPAALGFAAALLVMTVAVVSTTAYFREANLKTIADGKTAEAQTQKANAESQTTIAENQKQKAIESAERARKSEHDARQSLYYSQIALANHYLQEGDVEVAGELLAHCPTEFRHWEWTYLWPRAQFKPRTILPGVAVATTAFSPDSQQIMVGTAEGDLIVWDDVAQKVVLKNRVHAKAIRGIAFSADGRQMATSSADGFAKLWKMPSLDLAFVLRHPQSDPTALVAFSPDGSSLATACDNNDINIWNTTKGELSHSLSGEQTVPAGTTIAGLGWCADNRSLYCFASHGWLRRLDTLGERKEKKLQWSPINEGLRTSADGRYLAACGWWGMHAWDLREEEPQLLFSSYSVDYGHVDQSADGQTIVASSWNDAAFVFDVRSGHRLLRVPHVNGNRIVLSPDGARACMWSSDRRKGSLEVFATHVPANYCTVGPQTPPAEPSVHRVGTLVSLGGAVYDTATNTKLLGVGEAISPDRRFLYQGQESGILEIRDLATGSLDRTVVLSDPGQKLPSFAVSSDAQYIAVARDDGHIDILTSKNGNTIQRIDRIAAKRWQINPGQNLLRFSPRDDNLAVSYSDGSVRVWQARSGRLLAELHGHVALTDSGVQAIAFNGAGSLLATGGGRSDRKICLWRWQARENPKKPIVTMSGHTGGICTLAFSPDDRRLVSGGEDGTFRLWDPATGQEVLAVEASQGKVHAGFTPDGGGLLTWDQLFAVDRMKYGPPRLWGSVIAPLAANRPTNLLPWLRCYADTSRSTKSASTNVRLTSSQYFTFPIPVTSNGSYVLRAKFTRVHSEGKKTVGFLLPAGAGKTMLAVDHADRAQSGLDQIELHGLGDPVDTANPTNCPLRLIDGKSYTVEAHVELTADQAHITASLDGHEFVNWQGPQRALDMSSDWETVNPRAMGVALHDNVMVDIEQIELTPLDDDAGILEPPPGQESPPPPGATIVRDSKEIDLLPLVDLEHCAFDATVKRTPQGVEVASVPGKNGRVAVPVWPHGDYELTGSFSFSGNDRPVVLVPTPHNRVMIYWRWCGDDLSKSIAGFETIMGKLLLDPSNPTRVSANRVKAGQRYAFRVRVVCEEGVAGITVDLDGAPYLHWKGPESALTGCWDIPHQRMLGIGVGAGRSVTYHGLKLKMLNGEAWVLHPATGRNE